MDCSPPGPSVHRNSPGRNTRVGCHALFQGIFPTQGSNTGLPYCRRILYCLSYQGRPRTLEWVTYPFSRDRNWTRIACIPGRFFASWTTRKALESHILMHTHTHTRKIFKRFYRSAFSLSFYSSQWLASASLDHYSCHRVTQNFKVTFASWAEMQCMILLLTLKCLADGLIHRIKDMSMA